MSARAWIAAGIAATVAVLAAVVIVLVGHTGSTSSVTPASPLSVRASFSPAAVQFGDPVTAKVVVLLDRDAVDPGSLHLVDSLAPLTPLGTTRVTMTTRGRLVVVSYESPVACLSDRCVADKGAQRLELPAVAADAKRRGGGGLHAAAAWPTLQIGGRVTAADVARAKPPFQADTTPPAPDYRLSASTLALLLDLLAVMAAVAGIALATWEVLRRLRRSGPVPADGALARALRLAREAEARPAPDRRRAVGLVARILGDRDRGLATAASDLAWSRPKPDGTAVAELVHEVERSVEP